MTDDKLKKLPLTPHLPKAFVICRPNRASGEVSCFSLPCRSTTIRLMPQSERETRRHLQHLLAHRSPEDLIQRLAPKPGSTSRRIPAATITEPYAVQRRPNLLSLSHHLITQLLSYH